MNAVVQEVLQEIGKALATKSYGGKEAATIGYKAGLSPSTPSSPYMHGPGGLFGVSGLERDVISTRIQPFGLGSELPARGTIVTNPLYPYLLAYEAATGVNPVGVCDDAPTAGPAKTCIQTAQFGLFSYSTRTIDVSRNGQQTNRGEFLDLMVYNEPMLDTDGNGIPTPKVSGSPDLTREVLQRFVEVGVSFQNQLLPMVWTGNPANNTSGGGYKEFPGLDILIGTGKYDALSGTTCDALDSDVKDFNFERIDSGSGGNDIVATMSYLLRYLRYNADHMKLAPVDWCVVMRPELWWELTQVWPCAYMTYRCQNQIAGTTSNLFIDQADQLRMRDDMRNNMYLLIDGIKYPVIIDTGIVELTGTTSSKVKSGCFASNIYVIPRVVRGGLVSTYWEYLDYSQTAMIALQDGANNLGVIDFWTDGGRYLWHRKPPANWCIQWQAKIEPRVILRTPQLAGKVLDVAYCPMQHIREPNPSDPYFVDGGVDTRPGPSLWSDWNHP
jgi:hypothetical protein